MILYNLCRKIVFFCIHLLLEFHLVLAQNNGHFKEEIAPVTLKSRKGDQIFDVDEHPKPGTALDGLSKLPPVFKKNGTVTAGNASVSI